LISIVIIGAGQRGADVYGEWAAQHPELVSVRAVCDTEPGKAQAVVAHHGFTDAAWFETTNELFEAGRLAEACVIATPDRTHRALASAALSMDYHVLVEKPIATSLEDTLAVARAAQRSRGTLHVAHVLRYTPFFRALHEALEDVGEVVDVMHRENVAAWHMAHSFVRGNWARAEDSSPMIVAKSCHGFDILAWNLPRVTRLASFGGLVEFVPERAPASAAERCIDCSVEDCPYDARRVYLDERRTGWPVTVITNDLTPAGRRSALEHGPYGRCVYRAGSTVVDHQTVSMELVSGATATLTMHGHSPTEHRSMRYDGTRATVRGVFGTEQRLQIESHVDGRVRDVHIERATGGHGGGDGGLMRGFVQSVSTGSSGSTDVYDSIESNE
jgi:predicted dehydrogenase